MKWSFSYNAFAKLALYGRHTLGFKKTALCMIKLLENHLAKTKYIVRQKWKKFD